MSDKPKEPSGTQRIAALLLSLDKEVSARLMRNLDQAIVSDVAEAMTELSPELCTPEAVGELFEDLARAVHGGAGVRPQEDYELREILESSFGADEAARVIRDIHERRRNDQPFGMVDSFDPGVVARVLKEESPAVGALVMSHISPSLSAEVLAVLDEELALDIVKRMTTVAPPATETMLSIAGDLEERLKLAASLPAPPDPADSLRSIADLLNYSNPQVEKSLLEGLEADNEQVADQVRELMFTWEDLATIERRAMQKILASVDTRTLSMALKACSVEVEENVMANLSTRVRDMVKDERELAGAVPLSEVMLARNEIMLAIRSLMDTGEFSPARANEDLVT